MPPRNNNSTFSSLAWYPLTTLALAVSTYGLAAFVFPQRVLGDGLIYIGEPRSARNVALLTHFLTAGLALPLGLPQFKRDDFPLAKKYHSVTGSLYLTCVCVGAVAGYYIAETSRAANANAKIGFKMLATGWFSTAMIAYDAASKHQYERHRRWMIRNYAMTCAAISLRVMLGVMMSDADGAKPEEEVRKRFVDFVYPFVSFMCWVPNVLIAEAYLRWGNDVSSE